MLSKMLENKIEKEKQTALEEVKILAEHEGVPATTKLFAGNPSDEIVKFVQDDDLIVMASQGKKGFNKFLLGSVSEEVLKSAPCAVMIIKEKMNKRSMEFLTEETKV